MYSSFNENTIVEAITRKIISNEKDAIVYVEPVIQNFKRPSYVITSTSVKQEQIMVNRYYRTYNIALYYLFSDDAKNLNKTREESRKVLDYLTENLIYIEVPTFEGFLDDDGDYLVKTWRLKNKNDMEYVIENNSIRLFLTYQCKGFFTQEKQPKMGKLDITENIKE